MQIARTFALKWLTFLALLGTSFFFGMMFSASKNIEPVSSWDQMVETRESGHKLTNPLLECEYKTATNEKHGWLMASDIRDVISDLKNQGLATEIAFYFRDLNNGPWIGIQEKEAFIPASLLKLPLALTYYKLSEKDSSILQKELVADQSAKTEFMHNILPEDSVQMGKKYRVEDLIRLMIIHSDNAAVQLLFKNISPEIFTSIQNEMGIEYQKDAQNNLTISVKSYASFFRILYNASYLSIEDSERLLGLLSWTNFTAGIVAGVPEWVTVAHKYGERWFAQSNLKQLHDCGIVYVPGKPYLICIMTRWDDFSKLSQAIKSLSAFVYNAYVVKDTGSVSIGVQ